MDIIKRKGTGSVHFNINLKALGINPYKLYNYYLTPFGKLVVINSPLLTGEVSNGKI